jgi:hypothetical protein
MRRTLAFFAPFTGLLFAFGCTTNLKVGADGSGTGTGSSTSGTTGGSPTTTGTTTSSSTGTGAACGWDGSPVSDVSGPCGGNLWPNPPSCAAGLTCVTSNPDVVGTCAKPDGLVGGLGDSCGVVIYPCEWNLVCSLPPMSIDGPGTCVQPTCSGGTGGGGTGGASTGTGGTGTGGVGGTGGGCTMPLVTVEGDGPTKQFVNACQPEPLSQNPMAASGIVIHSVPPCNNCSDRLVVNGCSVLDDYNQPWLDLEANLGALGTTELAVKYKYTSDPQTNVSDGTGFITVTELDTDTIAGFYVATVTPASTGATLISGTFRVCRSLDATE